MYGKPLPGGYVARVPASVDRKWRERVARLSGRDRAAICAHHGLRFVLVNDRDVAGIGDARVLHRDGGVALLSLVCPSAAGGA